MSELLAPVSEAVELPLPSVSLGTFSILLLLRQSRRSVRAFEDSSLLM
jgi:hypothetical protein